MNFLDQIWLIPLFPLAGAVLMLLFGKMFDPQGQGPGAGSRGPGGEHARLKVVISFLCPGMVLLSFLLSCGAVWQLSRTLPRAYEVIQFTWVAGLPFQMANGQSALFHAD